MSKRSEKPQTPRHILVYDEDWEYLKAAYDRNTGAKPLGTSVAIRAIIHSFVRRLKANEAIALEMQAEAASGGEK